MSTKNCGWQSVGNATVYSVVNAMLRFRYDGSELWG
jgi:hypothetical protein